MNINLFKLALERLETFDWGHFEQLCSAFLVPEFPNLRTMAHPSGDGGRDSELFSPEGKPLIAAQYSIAAEWKAKVKQTAIRLSSTFPTVRILVYMSNRQIGGQADELKRELLDEGIVLDIRDRNWFFERAFSDGVRESAALQLIDQIARPYLAGERIIDKPTSPLTSGEARAALLYLGLQWQDDMTEKGLTKLSFDALVRAALRHTHSAKRMPRNQIHETVFSAISMHDQNNLVRHIDAALARLTKRYIRHWQKEDEFCLTHEEHQRILDRLAEMDNEQIEFYETVSLNCRDCLCEIGDSDQADFDNLRTRVPRVIERLLLHGGETFVTAVLSEGLTRVGSTNLIDIIMQDLEEQRPSSRIVQHYPKIIATVVQGLLSQLDKPTQLYLRRLASSYTLFSFLNQTPDVQAATAKLFSHGTVWVDTTVLLPLLAEQLDDNEQQRRFSKLFMACRSAGIEFRVTTGVIQEINAHMNNAIACAQYTPGSWRGRVPYLYYQYLQTGQRPIEFRKWLSLFRGDERPDDDLAQFLADVFDIKREELKEAAQLVGEELRWAVERLWSDAHKNRRRHAQQDDETTTLILIRHDVETYLGVIALRQKEEVTELGYRHWLLTLDTIAWDIRDRLRKEFPDRTPPSPLLSLSFLLNSMTFGPSRRRVGKAEELSLPLILDVEMSESMPYDILELADRVRQENVALPEYVIRRKVRDAIDQARRRRGCLGHNSIFEKDEAEPGAPVDSANMCDASI